MRGRVVIASIVLSLLIAASSSAFAQQPKQDEASPLLAQAAALARAAGAPMCWTMRRYVKLMAMRPMISKTSKAPKPSARYPFPVGGCQADALQTKTRM
jgi:hypothetical protein